MNTTLKIAAAVLLLSTAGCRRGDNASSQSPDYMQIAQTLSNNCVTCFEEDAYGYLWIGTERGLNRYNGNDFHRYYRTTDSLSLTDNHISCLYNDSRGRLWVGSYTGVCYFGEDGAFHRCGVESSSPYIHQILEQPDGTVLLNTGNDLTRLDEEAGRFVLLQPFPRKAFGSRCHIDRQGRIWVVSGVFMGRIGSEGLADCEAAPGIVASYMHPNGHLWLFRYDGRIEIFDTETERYTNDYTEKFATDRRLRGRFVVAAFGYHAQTVVLMLDDRRLLAFNYRTGELIAQDDPRFPFETPGDAILTTVYPDRQNNTWIGTTDRGFSVDYNYKRRFNDDHVLSDFFIDKSVVSITASDDGTLIVATDHLGLFSYRRDRRRIERLSVAGSASSPEHAECRFDSRGNLWLRNAGRLMCCRLEGTTIRPVRQIAVPGDLFTMCEGADGRMWFGGFGGTVYYLGPGDAVLTPVKIYDWTFTISASIVCLKSGEIVVASMLYGLAVIDPANDSVRRITPFGLTERFMPTALHEDRSGTVWIGTRGDGLLRWDPATDEIVRIGNPYCADIAAIAEAPAGTLWISTLDGLLKYDPAAEHFTAYSAADGIGGTQFNKQCVLRQASDMLLFGGTHGLTVFDPAKTDIRRDIDLRIEELTVDNCIQQPGRSRSLDRSLLHLPPITIYPRQSSIGLSFAALDFSEYPDKRYFYKLEGYDTEWIDSRGGRWANYSLLPSGSYLFRVRLMDKDGTTQIAETSVPVRVRVPFYAHPFMLWGVYPLLLAFGAGILWMLWRRGERSKIEAAHEKRINDMNMSFFSNISHEFRTPLTMIVGPVRMLQQTCDDPEQLSLLKIVRRNIDRMLRLVNQLMDFNKLEQDALRLKVRRADLVSQLGEMSETFIYNARRKQMEFCTSGLEGTLLMLLDADKIEKIVTNLVSNALKFAPPQSGRIELRLDTIGRREVAALFPPPQKYPAEASGYVEIRVADNGPGIPEEFHDRIFRKYFQVDKGTCPNWGTGIGLYFAKRLVELHHGAIRVDNRPSGGAEFTVVLPMDDAVYADEERAQPELRPSVAADMPLPDAVEEPEAPAGDERQVILVVDDDAEVANFLQTLLSPHYRVVVRFDGKAALEYLETEQPDLVLSDVVMLGMDGYELCRRIKENIATSHVPVILVTAKSTVGEQVAGLEYGADAYVVKPFDPIYLLALVKSQLRNREVLRNMLGKATPTEQIDRQMLSDRDQQFLDQLYAMMETELSNPELNIVRLTEKLHISRTKFYYKVKGLTGVNPNVFFKTYKLNRAAELILSGNYAVSEVADMTGFSTQPYFSTCFKRHFGVNPSEYAKTRQEKMPGR